MTQATAPAVVTEYTWDRVTNRADMARRRTVKVEPVVVPAVCRTTHVAGCSRMKGDVVATGTVDEMLDLEPWPCDCVTDLLRGFGPSDLGTTTDAPRPTVLASPKQVAFLRSLGFDGDAENLSRTDASATIDRLLAAKAAAPTAPAAPVTENDDRPHVPGLEVMSRSNRYGGTCEFCGNPVEAEAGRLAKRAGKWTVVHNDGECLAKVERQPEPQHAAPAVTVPDGRYAIPSTGDNDLVFYRVKAGRNPGVVFVDMVLGGGQRQPVRRENVRGILARIAEFGPDRAAACYGQELGKCSRCQHDLSNEVSRYTGLGPDCREILGVVVTDEMKAAAHTMAAERGWVF